MPAPTTDEQKEAAVFYNDALARFAAILTKKFDQPDVWLNYIDAASSASALVAAGVREKRQYSEHPARSEYYLTKAGRDLYPVIATLMRWGDEYLAGHDGPPLVLEHTCGHQLVASGYPGFIELALATLNGGGTERRTLGS